MSDFSMQLAGLSKKFGVTQVLNDISLDIQSGEFVVLLGESGCGKSTLLKIIAGLESADEGCVTLKGCDVTRLPPRQRKLGMVFQSYALYPHLSVSENISFPLKMASWRFWYSLPLLGPLFPGRRALSTTYGEAAREAARMVNLEALLERKPAQLSGGQRQRVALARALVDRRDIWLMDEPLSNLDAQLRARTRGEIAALHESLRPTVVYVTHDQIEAMTMGTRVVVMRHGRIEQQGSPEALYEDPQTMYVAEFLGAPRINFLPVRTPIPVNAIGRVPLGHIDGDGDSDLPLALGVRPDRVHIEACPEGAYTLTQDEYTGGQRIHTFRALDGPLAITAVSAERLTRGARFALSCAPQDCLYFQRKGGHRVHV